jgi:tRNA (guanine37-N1)-methyltransferase
LIFSPKKQISIIQKDVVQSRIMKFTVLSIFPDLFKPFVELGLMGRAVKEGKVSIEFKHLRDYAINNQGQLDDTPYGGGSGMVLRPEPAFNAIREAKQKNPQAKVVLLTPRGEPFSHSLAKKLHAEKDLILLCCRYEGVDERVAQNFVDYQISVGDYIMMGGELPAMTLMEAVTRFVPDVLGNSESLSEESFTSLLLEYPQYTKPQDFQGHKVPEVLLSGNHKNIADWRELKAVEDTRSKRVDLYQQHCASKNSKQQSFYNCPISVALVHHPVLNKEGKVITSSITNLDLHDISRSAKTYGIEQYFLVHPIKAMRMLMETICQHWDVGYGSTYNPNRKDALSIARIVPDFEDVIIQMEDQYGKRPKIIVTSAKPANNSISFSNLKKVLANSSQPYLIVFGTGWGLTDELMNRADYTLEPVRGVSDFNHLSVRAAAAIILDRLLGI